MSGPTVTVPPVTRSTCRSAISQMVSSATDPAAVLAYFVEGIDDPALIDELAALVDRMREGRDSQ